MLYYSPQQQLRLPRVLSEVTSAAAYSRPASAWTFNILLYPRTVFRVPFFSKAFLSLWLIACRQTKETKAESKQKAKINDGKKKGSKITIKMRGKAAPIGFESSTRFCKASTDSGSLNGIFRENPEKTFPNISRENALLNIETEKKANTAKDFGELLSSISANNKVCVRKLADETEMEKQETSGGKIL